MSNTNKAEELAKEYSISIWGINTQVNSARKEQSISDFIQGYNSRQSEIDELTKQLKQEVECVEFIKQTCDEYEKQNAELTKEVERLRKEKQLTVDSLLKIRKDIFENSSDQLLVKFGVNNIDALLYNLTTP